MSATKQPKKHRGNYVPRILWECYPNVYQFWVVTASAQVPGDPDLIVSTVHHIPFVYAETVLGLSYYLGEVVRDSEVSLTCKYNMLVRKHAPTNKRAQAALATITEWQKQNEKTKTEIKT